MVLSPSKQGHTFIIGENDQVDIEDAVPLVVDSEDNNDNFVIETFFRLGNAQTKDTVFEIHNDYCEFLYQNLGVRAMFELSNDDGTGGATLLIIPLSIQRGTINGSPAHHIVVDSNQTVKSDISFDPNTLNCWIEEDDNQTAQHTSAVFTNIINSRGYKHGDSNSEVPLDHDVFVYESEYGKRASGKNLDEYTSDWLRKFMNICTGDFRDSLCFTDENEKGFKKTKS